MKVGAEWSRCDHVGDSKSTSEEEEEEEEEKED